MKKQFPYVREYKDPDGSVRFYFQRHRRGKKTRINEPAGSQGFVRAYQALLSSATPVAYTPHLIMRTDKPGFVYFLTAGGDIKIGFTTEPVSRVQGLKTGFPVAIEMLIVVPGTRHDERALHQMLAADRLSGEWFKTSRKVRDVMIRSAVLGRPATEERTGSRPGAAALGANAEKSEQYQ